MDANELLARENEFKRLNQQLEKKTESLMKEIDYAMQKQDFFAAFSPSLTPTEHRLKKHCCTPPTSAPSTPIRRPIRKKSLDPSSDSNSEYDYTNRTYKSNSTQNNSTFMNNTESVNSSKYDVRNSTQIVCDCCPKRSNEDMEFLYAFVSVNVKDKVLPPSFSKERVTVETVCKFLSSKIRLMQEQIDKLQNVINKKASQCEGHLTQLAEYEGERLSLLNRANTMRTSSADSRAKCLALQKRLEEKEKQYREQRGECDKLSSELSRALARLTAAGARAASHQQQLDSMKQQREQAKHSEKEFREATRTLTSTHQSAISRLESRVKSYSSLAARQAALVDNLRTQNLLLATEGAVRCLERDYCNFLSQDL